jgi:hypothetical protein
MVENTELEAASLNATDANQEQDFASIMSSQSQANNTTTVPENISTGPGDGSFAETMRNAQNASAQQLAREVSPRRSLIDSMTYQESPGVRYQDADTIANFTQQESFNASGFNPLDSTNFDRALKEETWGTALAKGFDSMSSKFGAAFKENFVGYGRLGSAIANMDMSLLMPSEDEMMQQYYQDQKDAQKNFVFQTPEDQDSIFTKGTISEFIGSSGFMLGTFGALSLEIAADILITGLTLPEGGAGAALFAPTFAKIGAGFGRMMGKEAIETSARESAEALATKTNIFRDVAQGFTLGNKSAEEIRLLNKIGEASEIANVSGSVARQALNDTFTVFSGNLPGIMKSKSIAELTGNVARGLPLLGSGIRYGERVAAGVEAGLSTGKLIGIGAQGLRRVAQELNMSATEASFEAVSSYGDTLNKLIEDHRNSNNGDDPNDLEFEEMRRTAMDSSGANYKTNMAILLATNKLQFGNMFNKFIPANKTMRELVEATKDNLLLVEKNGLKKFYKKGFAGAYGVTGQIAKDFGKKEATYQVGKAFFKDIARFELVEGLQENLQGISANGWKDYYVGQYQKSNSVLSESFGKAFEDEISKQGLKTFLMGALTGTLVRLPVHVTTKTLEAVSDKMSERQYAKTPGDNPVLAVKKQFDKDIENLNTFFKQTEERNFKHKIVNFVNQVQEGQNQAEAAAKGLQYEFENSRDNALVSAISAAKRTDSIDVLQRAVREMGVDMSNEDFEKSFGVKLEDTKYATPLDFSKNLANDIKKYSDVTDGLRNKIKNFTEPSLYTPGSKEHYTAMIARSAEEDAVHIIAMNAVKGDMTAKRASQISQELLSNSSIATSSDYVIRVLTDPKILNDELGNIMSELRIYENNLDQNTDASLTPKIKKQIEDKKDELENLQKWQSYFSKRTDVGIALNEEGEVVTRDNVVLDTFVGKRLDKAQTVTNEDGEDVASTDTAFDSHDAEVIEVFRKLLNVKNKQAGIDTEISETAMRDVHDKLVDYMKLDKDTKDYMSAVDTLMNPKNFKYAISKMSDGKMKFQIISFLNRFQLDIYASVYGQGGLLDSLEEVNGAFNQSDKVQIGFEVMNMLYEDENYKNLLTISLDPNLGIANGEYAQKLFDDLKDNMIAKFADITKKYAPNEYAEDITDEEYDQMIATGKIEPVKEQLLVDKIARGEIALGPNEEKLVNSSQFKQSIDALVEIAKQNITPVNLDNQTFQDPDDGTFGVMDSNNTVITQGHATEEEAVAAANGLLNTSEDPVHEIPETTPGQQYLDMSELELRHKLTEVNEIYDELTIDGTQEQIDDILLEKQYIIAALNKIINKTSAPSAPVAPVEEVPEEPVGDVQIPDTLMVGTKIFYTATPGIKGVITAIDRENNTVNFETDKIDSEDKDYNEFIKEYSIEEEQPPAPPQPAPIVTPAPVVTPTPTPAPTPNVNRVPDENENALDQSALLRQMMGLPAVEPVTKESFVVQTNTQQTFDVKDKNDNVVQTVETEVKAQEIVDSANNTRKDIEFVKTFMDSALTNPEDKLDTMMYSSMQARGEKSMKLHNSKNGTDFKTLQEYASIKEGKTKLEGIRESVITGKPIKYAPKKKAPAVGKEQQIDLFDVVNTPNVLSTNRNMLESLNEELKDFKTLNAEKSKEISKFVKEDIITDASIIDQLKDAFSCFK